jgi:hypothetical protein
MPSEVVRGFVSLWILIHFFGVALALATGTGMGTSQLLGRIKSAPILDQYLFALWLDVPHDYRFTFGQEDGDYEIRAELKYADEHTESRVIQPEDAHGERLERYQQLAHRAAMLRDDGTPNPFVPTSLGGALLKQLKDSGVEEVTFRVVRHAPLTSADVSASDPGQRDPRSARMYITAMTAIVSLDSRGQPQVRFPAQSATDVAPVTNPNPAQPDRKSGSSKRSSTGPSTIRPPNNRSISPINVQDELGNEVPLKAVAPNLKPSQPK